MVSVTSEKIKYNDEVLMVEICVITFNMRVSVTSEKKIKKCNNWVFIVEIHVITFNMSRYRVKIVIVTSLKNTNYLKKNWIFNIFYNYFVLKLASQNI